MRAKHARNRARRRIVQGRWTADDLSAFADRRFFRSPGMRKSMREIKGSGYRQHPFLVLQNKYPWPTSRRENWKTHSAMLHRRMANLKKIHTMYQRRK